MGYAAEKLDETSRLETSVGTVAAVVPLRRRAEGVERAVLAFPAALLPLLPVPVRLDLEGPGGRRFSVVLDEAEAEARRATEPVVLGPRDWELVVLGVESDRLRPMDVASLLEARARGPLTEDDVLAGAQPDPARGLDAGRVLTRLGLVVRSCETIERARDAA
jgi:hypothetical protein